MSKITNALALLNNPATSFSNSEHPCSRKEVANILTLLVTNSDSWKDLGANEFEVTQNIGRLIDSFKPPTNPDRPESSKPR